MSRGQDIPISGPGVEVIKTLNPEVNINNTRKFVAQKGAQTISSQVYPAPNVNNSSVQVTMTPPSNNTIISRTVLKKAVWNVTVTGTNTSGSPTLIQDGSISTRAWPLLQITNSENISINNQSITQSNMNNYWQQLLWYNAEFGLRDGQFSMAHSTLDQSQNYDDLSGSTKNPLLDYASSAYQDGRSSMGWSVISSTATEAVIQVQTIEPVMISPFTYGDEIESGLIGVNQMTYTTTFTNPNRILSIIKDQGVTGIDITSVNANLTYFALEMMFLTPDPVENIPRELVSSYYTITDNPTPSNQSVAPGQLVQINMSSINLQGVPKRVILFVSESTTVISADTLGTLTDSTMSLAPGNPISMTWNNKNFFNSTTQEQFYQISQRNGYSGSFAQFAGVSLNSIVSGGYCGSIVCLDFAKDIGLEAGEAPGVLGQYQLFFTTNWLNTNLTKTIINPTLHCLVFYEGTFRITDGFCSAQTNVLSQMDVLSAPLVQGLAHMESKTVYGGSFEGFINALNKGVDYVKDNKLLSKGLSLIPHPYAQLGSQAASTFGYGNKQFKQPATKSTKKPRKKVYGSGMYNQQYQDSSSEDSY